MQNDLQKKQALWVVFAATAAVRIGFGAIMPILPIYAKAHGLSTIMIAMMTNAYLLTNAVFQSAAGHLSDRRGRRPVMLAGTWLYTAAAALFLVDGGPWYYVALRGLEGLGASAFGPTARAYVAELVPREKLGQTYGALGAFDTAGILVGPLVGGLAQAIGGPKAPFAVCALLGLLAGVPLILFARTDRRAASAGGDAVSAAGLPLAPSGAQSRIILRSPAFWAVALPGLGIAYLNGMYSVVWSLYMTRIGASLAQITASFTLFAIPMVALMVPFGKLADRVGRPLMVGLGGVASTVSVLSYGLLPYPNSLIGFGVLDGVGGAAFSPASQAFMADVTPDSVRGRFTGLVGSVSTAATLVATTGVGYLYTYSTPLVVFGLGAASLLFSCGTAVYIMARYPVDRLRHALEQQLQKGY